MLEMVYQRTRKNPIEVLAHGCHENYYYLILNLGTHPTAYVELPADHPFYKKFYDEVNSVAGDESPVHGFFTYSGELASAADFDTPIKEGWYLGWDYCHAGDWSGTLDDETNISLHYKKYTIAEMHEDCIRAIDWIIEHDGSTKCEKMGGENLTKCDSTEDKLTVEEVLEAAKDIRETSEDVIEICLKDTHILLSDTDKHMFWLVKTRKDQEVMIVPEAFAKDIRGKVIGNIHEGSELIGG